MEHRIWSIDTARTSKILLTEDTVDVYGMDNGKEKEIGPYGAKKYPNTYYE